MWDEGWTRISYLLCVYGFLREMRPSDPYFIEYLRDTHPNITEAQINRDVLPVVTYSHLSQLVVIFLVTDYFRYKPLLIITSFAGILVWALLIWTVSLPALQLAHFLYGTFMAGEIAYFTYVYAKVDKVYYAQITAHARAAMLAGKFFGCVVAQIVIKMNLLKYRDLNLLTFTGQIAATAWAFRLPRARKSLYFHRHYSVIDPVNYPIPPMHRKDDEEAAERISNYSQSEFDQVSPAKLLWIHVRDAYTNKQVLLWSIFYAAGTCGYLQVYSYVQMLWREIDPTIKMPWNAAVDGMLRFFGALAAFAAGYLDSDKYNPRAYLMSVGGFTTIQGMMVLVSCFTHKIFISYLAYIAFGILHCLHITIASTEVAKHLKSESFALIFGINTFFALLMQTILTLLVVADIGFALGVIDQYAVSGIYYIIIGMGYLIYEGCGY